MRRLSPTRMIACASRCRRDRALPLLVASAADGKKACSPVVTAGWDSVIATLQY